MEASDHIWIGRQPDHGFFLPFVRQQVQDVAQAFQSRSLLVVCLDDDPRADEFAGWIEEPLNIPCV